MNKYGKEAQEINDRAEAERRPMTERERTQCVAYARASLDCVIDLAVEIILRDLRKATKHGALSGVQVKRAKLLASNGFREAKEILDAHFQRNNYLPALRHQGPKPFKSFRNGAPEVGNSAKTAGRDTHALV